MDLDKAVVFEEHAVREALNVTACRVGLVGLGWPPQVRAFADVVLEGCFRVTGLRVIERDDGSLFVAMPQSRRSRGAWMDLCHPTTPKMRAAIEDVVIEKYLRIVDDTKGWK